MPRSARNHCGALCYHVMAQGLNKEFIFNSDKYKAIYLRYVMEAAQKYEIEIVAYCIMGNHAHLLLRPKQIKDLSKCMQSINIRFSQVYNKDNKRVRICF